MISAREQAEAISTLEAAIAQLRSMKVSRSCSDCEHWGPVGCALAGAVPPLDVQSVGCELWKWSGCPF